MSEQEDYADKDLPPPWRPSRIEVALLAFWAIVIAVLAAIGLFKHYLMQFAH